MKIYNTETGQVSKDHPHAHARRVIQRTNGLWVPYTGQDQVESEPKQVAEKDDANVSSNRKSSPKKASRKRSVKRNLQCHA